MKKVFCLIFLSIIFLQCAAMALSSNTSIEGILEVTSLEGRILMTDPTHPLSIGLKCEVNGEVLDYGCNYYQLFNDAAFPLPTINKNYPGGYFRIDLRPAYDYQFFNVAWIPPNAASKAEEIHLYQVSTRGAMSMISYVSAESYKSFVSLGTPPLTVISSTACTNLNADYLDGYHASYFTGRLVSCEVFTTTGSSTYTVPSGVTAILVECVAGGGGGGGGDRSGTGSGASGGGGGGSYARKFILSPAASYSVSIGTGGGGGALGPNNGSAGNNTTFGSPAIITCNGGSGGVAMTAGTTVIVAAGGGGGAVSTGGDVNIGGCAGGYAFRGSTTVAASGNGGSSYFGGGAVGIVAEAAGNNAANYGAGGSGGLALTGGTADRAGGNGSQGVIYVWEYK